MPQGEGVIAMLLYL